MTRHLAEAVGLAGSGSSFLESRSVAPATLRTYREALELFKKYAEDHRLAQGSDESQQAALGLTLPSDRLRPDEIWTAVIWLLLLAAGIHVFRRCRQSCASRTSSPAACRACAPPAPPLRKNVQHFNFQFKVI